MRSVDDGESYYVPVRKRGWVKPGGYWRKRNMLRAVRSDHPPTKTPPKMEGKKRPGVQLSLYSRICPETGFITNFVWSDE